MKKYLTIAAVALLAALSLTALPASAQEDDDESTITVSGSGSASGAPDVASIEIGVQARNTDVLAAFEEANSTIDAVIEAIVESGVAREDIRTVGLNINQEFNGGPPMPGAPGDQTTPEPVFVVNNRVMVTIRDTDNIANVINASVGAGANSIFGLNFGIQDRDALVSDARANAMEDARSTAQELADLAGVELGSVVRIRETGGGMIPPRAAFDQAGLGGGGGAVIEQGQLSVQVQVEVTYRIND
jgi:hypothetical protein